MLPNVAAGLTNRAIRRNGVSNVVLSRPGGTDVTNPQAISTPSMTAFVRKYSVHEVVQRNGAVELGDTLVVLMGAAVAALRTAFGPNATIRNTDKLSVNGFERAIVAPSPIVLGAQTVRLDLTVRG